MTSLKIDPFFAKKTARCVGCVAAGEHVDVRIRDGAYLLPSSTLRLRVKFANDTIAVFPCSDDDKWGSDGADLKCHLSLNTVQAKSICRFGETPCLIILDQVGDNDHTEEPTLFFEAVFQIKAWYQEPGADVPYDLGRYPDQIRELERKIETSAETVEEAKAAVLAAKEVANSAKESAQDALGSAQNANAQAGLASSAAQNAAKSAARTEQSLSQINNQVEESKDAALASEGSARKAAEDAGEAAESAGAAKMAATEAVAAAQGAANAINAHKKDFDNPHKVTKSQIGLGSVDDTADMNKPVSHAQRAAIEAEKARAEAAEKDLSDRIARIKTMTKRVVDALPDVGEEDVLYLVPSQKSAAQNVRNEYLWINGAWELIGSTAVDLSEYVKTSDVVEPSSSATSKLVASARSVWLKLGNFFGQFPLFKEGDNGSLTLSNSEDFLYRVVYTNIAVGAQVSKGSRIYYNGEYYYVRKTFDKTSYGWGYDKLAGEIIEYGASGSRSLSTGKDTLAVGENSVAHGTSSFAEGNNSSAEGTRTLAKDDSSHAEGSWTIAEGDSSHAEGGHSKAIGMESHAEGSHTEAKEQSSHAEGYMTTASDVAAHAEGWSTTAEAYDAHAEGYNTKAKGQHSHAEGHSTTAEGNSSHAEGQFCHAAGDASHASGFNTLTAKGINDDGSVDTPHHFAFAWQGEVPEGALGEPYKSHGEGTFNINPAQTESLGPGSEGFSKLTGFFIGTKNLWQWLTELMAFSKPEIKTAVETELKKDFAPKSDLDEKLNKSAVVAPSYSATTGQAADAASVWDKLGAFFNPNGMIQAVITKIGDIVGFALYNPDSSDNITIGTDGRILHNGVSILSGITAQDIEDFKRYKWDLVDREKEEYIYEVGDVVYLTHTSVPEDGGFYRCDKASVSPYITPPNWTFIYEKNDGKTGLEKLIALNKKSHETLTELPEAAKSGLFADPAFKDNVGSIVNTAINVSKVTSATQLAHNKIAVVSGAAGGTVSVSIASYANGLRRCQLLITDVASDKAVSLDLPAATYKAVGVVTTTKGDNLYTFQEYDTNMWVVTKEGAASGGGGGSSDVFFLNADGDLVTSEDKLNEDGTVTVEGELNEDGTYTVTV